MNEIENRLNLLRNRMREEGVQALVVPTSDYHDTEYVAPYFQARKWLSGFTGSAGTLIILPEKAALWTDGRYFIQAEQELDGTGIDLMRIGEPETPSMEDYLLENLEPGQVAAIDGLTMSRNRLSAMKDRLEEKNISLITDVDFPGLVWEDRPAFPGALTFYLEEKYSGKSPAEKLAEVRKEMQDADALLLSKIDEIAWLFNIRARDIPSLPAPLSYALVTRDGGILFTDEKRVDEKSREVLEENGIEILPYEKAGEVLEGFDGKIMTDFDTVPYLFSEKVRNPLVHASPVIHLKAVKNETEQDGFRRAHVKDGVALVKFIHWLKNNREPITEMDVVRKLHAFRQEQENFIEDSFTTISAWNGNGAIVHYHPGDDHPVSLEENGMLLLDSGGHYLEGTTDITRTIVLGEIPDEWKKRFTEVLKGHIALGSIHFPKGTNGAVLDVLARAPLWRQGKDYKHGTGHGVAMVTNVHEGPQSFRWSSTGQGPMELGMITSNEPGYYHKGEFGIRHENLLLTVPAENGEYGEFYAFEPLTLVPFDRAGIDETLLNSEEVDYLNAYHKKVYDTLSPYLDEEERVWLKEETRPY